jgi:vacuolar-type H+-ATPase subunit E/Vma4
MSLVGAEAKAEKLNAQKKLLDDVMKKTQDIIDQMLPKQVAAVCPLRNISIIACVSTVQYDSATWYSTHLSSTLLRFHCENDVFI